MQQMVSSVSTVCACVSVNLCMCMLATCRISFSVLVVFIRLLVLPFAVLRCAVECVACGVCTELCYVVPGGIQVHLTQWKVPFDRRYR